jgi:hypothetical protein
VGHHTQRRDICDLVLGVSKVAARAVTSFVYKAKEVPVTTTASDSTSSSRKSTVVNEAALRERLRAEAAGVEKPLACVFCCHSRVWWNGDRGRAVTVLVLDLVLHVAGIRCRRVRCAKCKTSWTLRPEWITPQRQVQLTVVAMVVAKVLFNQQEAGAKEPFVSQESAGKAVGCSRRTVGRWLRWVAEACPGLRSLSDKAMLGRKAGSVALGLRHRLERAAVQLYLEALAPPRKLEATGQSSVLAEAIGTSMW